MSRIIEFLIFSFVQLTALTGILIGCGYIPPLVRLVSAASDDQPWNVAETARLTAIVCGPVLIGLLVMIGSILYMVYLHRLRKRMAAFPNEPWLWRTDWAAGLVRLSNRSAVTTTIITTVFYVFVILPLGVFLASVKNTAMVYGFLGVLGLFMLVFFRILWANRRWNESELQLVTLPGLIGEQFSAVATIPEMFPEAQTFQVKLRCELTQSHGSRSGGKDDVVSVLTGTKNNHRSSSYSHTMTVYEDCRSIEIRWPDDGSGRTKFPVTFDIPAAQQPSGKRTQGSSVTEYINWTIRISTGATGDLREAVFEVPVFQSAASG
jgi:hypothetical protein